MSWALRSEEHTSELQSHSDLVCRLLLEKKKKDRHQPGNRPQNSQAPGQPAIVLAAGVTKKVAVLCGGVAGLTSAFFLVFFFNDTATTEIYTLSLHDALPISPGGPGPRRRACRRPRRGSAR